MAFRRRDTASSSWTLRELAVSEMKLESLEAGIARGDPYRPLAAMPSPHLYVLLGTRAIGSFRQYRTLIGVDMNDRLWPSAATLRRGTAT